MKDHLDLSGKVALVTGGSRGLGYQIVKAYAAHGADVIIASRKLGGCETVSAEVRAMGRRALAVACQGNRLGGAVPGQSNVELRHRRHGADRWRDTLTTNGPLGPLPRSR